MAFQEILKKQKLNIVLIDGPDAIGKTTVIDMLRKKYGWIPVKASVPPKDSSIEERTRILTDYLAILRTLKSMNIFGNDHVWILDRFYPSEYVYGKVKRGYEPLKKLWKVEKEILSNHHLYVYCWLDKKQHLKRFSYRKDDYMKKEDIEPLVNRYGKFFNKTKMKKIKIDMDDFPVKNAEKIGKVFNNGKY